MIDPDRMMRSSLGQLEQIQAELAAERAQVFEKISESGLCRVFVGLDGNLLDVVFFRNDVFGLDEPSAVAREILETIKAARVDAAAVVDRIVERLVPEGGEG